LALPPAPSRLPSEQPTPGAHLADLVARVLVAREPPERVAHAVTAFRQPFTGVHFAGT
jgi:hypothetical protein